MSEILVARQPIYDRTLAVYGYELLFRDAQAPHDGAVITDDRQATSRLILNAFMEIGIGALIGPHRAFINVPREFLVGEHQVPFPRERTVIEILERVEVDDATVEGARRLAAQGYMLALDDFVWSEAWEPLLPLVQIVKLDVRALDRTQLAEHVQRLRPRGLRLLAEKVETREEYEACRLLGFEYFQGFFLSRPSVVRGKRVPENRLHLVQLIAQLGNPEIDLHEIENLIGRDVTLSYKLLRYINSAFFNLPRHVESIRQAVMYVGLIQIRTWAMLMAVSAFDDRPPAVIHLALVRARLCQLIAEGQGTHGPDRYFTAGLLSALDILIEQPLDEIIATLPLADELRAALLTREGHIGEALACALAFEQWEPDKARCGEIPCATLSRLHAEAAGWAHQVQMGFD